MLLQARCRKSMWHVLPVELGNISEGGCSIVGNVGSFAEGEVIQLRIAHLKPIEGHIRWRNDDVVGVEFTSSLKGRVVRDLDRIYGIVLDDQPQAM